MFLQSGDLAGDLARLREELQQLQNDNSKLKRDGAALQGNVDKLRGENSTLQGDLEAASSEATRLKNDASKFKDEIAGLREAASNGQPPPPPPPPRKDGACCDTCNKVAAAFCDHSSVRWSNIKIVPLVVGSTTKTAHGPVSTHQKTEPGQANSMNTKVEDSTYDEVVEGCGGITDELRRLSEAGEKDKAELAKLTAEHQRLHSELGEERQARQRARDEMVGLQRSLAMAKEAAARVGMAEAPIPCAGCPYKVNAAPRDIEDQVDAAQVIQRNFRKAQEQKVEYEGEKRIDNELQKFEGKTLSWMKKLMLDLFSTKIVADANDDRKNNRRQHLAEYFFDYARTVWGHGHKKEEMIETTISTIRRYREEDLDVMTLSNFLQEVWELPAQNTYLYVMQLQGDNRKGKPPRQRVTLESSWSVITEKALGKMDVELWNIVHEKIDIAWRKEGEQMEPRKKMEKQMSSDLLRTVITQCHIDFDKKFGTVLPKLYRQHVPSGSLEERMSLEAFSDMLAVFDHRLGQDPSMWQTAQVGPLAHDNTSPDFCGRKMPARPASPMKPIGWEWLS